ncbi:siroheme decarboxylase subunit alpha [Clostridium estertheticum]|uniref:siroheme decarboxylase subunit alpha n=1 Tax=Clostridium estertheticum TaxID=238834 RepID=UPI001C0E813D|nr:Lrp/AsnC family transcriptional regulator [Clostridium estertheticum]MBU3072285.1 Lrp/AsnC family transcriptional regulator [Clostridium estertheticum]MBU3162377.1 Lrp/AsnC family transcriptional regulator [Clostridium estertheticum]MBU3184581.1 Lrp/AsnC family transcriptional regulator [Clostridium estertheticum]MBX4269675.1 Lrp/AsnC family transcriptional regulator [Clostridium estertheticum]MCB2339455.1 Lrp/AsnC family transcriptional regulator [Clostridium estertheticum]
MDKTNKNLLNLIQSNFPIESRPFLKIANELDISENQVIDMIKELKNDGYIKRIGGIFDSRKLGYSSTLCAIKVPLDRITEVAEIINSYNGVTHNYIRNHSYNMWFTVIAPSIIEVKEFLNDIKIKTDIDEIIELPVVNLFKINVVFNIKE